MREDLRSEAGPHAAHEECAPGHRRVPVPIVSLPVKGQLWSQVSLKKWFFESMVYISLPRGFFPE